MDPRARDAVAVGEERAREMAQWWRRASIFAHDWLDRDWKADGPALLRAQAAQPRRPLFATTDVHKIKHILGDVLRAPCRFE